MARVEFHFVEVDFLFAEIAEKKLTSTVLIC